MHESGVGWSMSSMSGGGGIDASRSIWETFSLALIPPIPRTISNAIISMATQQEALDDAPFKTSTWKNEDNRDSRRLVSASIDHCNLVVLCNQQVGG